MFRVARAALLPGAHRRVHTATHTRVIRSVQDAINHLEPLRSVKDPFMCSQTNGPTSIPNHFSIALCFRGHADHEWSLIPSIHRDVS